MSKAGLDLVALAAETVAPRPAPRPSDWAAENLVLSNKESPDAPGPFDPDALPWQRAVIDLPFDRNDRRGAVIVKRSQVGISIAMLVDLAYFMDTSDGPMLYTIADALEATNMAHSRFRPMCASSPRLDASIKAGTDGQRDLMAELHYASGRIDFVGGGSPSRYSTRPYRRIWADEWENIEKNFPTGAVGDPHKFLLGRMGSFTLGTWFCALGHPTMMGRGIEALWDKESDQGEWVFDCPHCSATIYPRWSTCVRFGERDAHGQDVAESASFCCPSCAAVISDRDRREAVWPASERHPRGSGRLGTQLGNAEAAKRPYAGVRISGLVDPRRDLIELTSEWCTCQTDEARQAFLNTRIGEGFTPARAMLTIDQLDRSVSDSAVTDAIPAVPGGPEHGARLIVAGIDVQAPQQDPTFYAWVRAYAPGGVVYSLDMPRIGGVNSWDALERWASEWSCPVLDDAGQMIGRIGLQGVGIDAAYPSPGIVYDWCRRPIAMRHGVYAGSSIKLVPVRFRSQLHGDVPWTKVPASKCIDKERPQLGPIDSYYLHRHTAIDRTYQTLAQERTVFLHTLDDARRAHLVSQVLMPLRKQHGQESHERLEWDCAKGSRDDWMTAGAYADAAAAIALRLAQLDTLPSLSELVHAQPSPPRDPGRGGQPIGQATRQPIGRAGPLGSAYAGGFG
ncbi:MAG: terminase gpA endonuclease subunit [Planctomycetota bacterium]